MGRSKMRTSPPPTRGTSTSKDPPPTVSPPLPPPPLAAFEKSLSFQYESFNNSCSPANNHGSIEPGSLKEVSKTPETSGKTGSSKSVRFDKHSVIGSSN